MPICLFSSNNALVRLGLSFVLGLSSFACIAGTIDSGENAYERCALCHGLYGVSPRSKFPILAGQNPVYLRNQIQAFLSESRTNDGGQMQGVVTEISEEQIVEVVEWFSSQNLPVANAAHNMEGEVTYKKHGCNTCHLENRSSKESVPLLYAQHKDYLAKQMRDLRDNKRKTEYEIALHKRLDALNDTEIGALAEYLASREHEQ